VVFVLSPLWLQSPIATAARPLLPHECVGFCAADYPAFGLISSRHSLVKLVLVQSGFALTMAMYAGPAISVYAELFPTRLRSTAVSLTYNLTAALVGGFAPFIVTWLIAATGNPLAPALYVVGAAIISSATVGLHDRLHEPLR
jgi:MFS transporter, MHS family, proline/betaine transporter